MRIRLVGELQWWDMGKAYISDPSEDVSVEAYVVLRNVNPALYQNFTLQRASIVYIKQGEVNKPPPNDK